MEGNEMLGQPPKESSLGSGIRVTPLEDTLSVLAASTGEDFSAESFYSRVRIQKAVYLLQAFGHDVGKEYSFSNYFHGPYSPSLARDYYGDDRKPALDLREEATVDLPDDVIEAVSEAVAHPRGKVFLEAATTIHSIAERKDDADKEAILGVVRRIKGHLDEEVLEEAWTFLTDKDLIKSHT